MRGSVGSAADKSDGAPPTTLWLAGWSTRCLMIARTRSSGQSAMIYGFGKVLASILFHPAQIRSLDEGEGDGLGIRISLTSGSKGEARATAG
jgi:hypothetical protein